MARAKRLSIREIMNVAGVDPDDHDGKDGDDVVDEASISSDQDDEGTDHQRKMKKELRRAKKIAKRLAKLGLDENGEELDNYALSKYPVREYKFTLPCSTHPVALNPVVTLMSIVVLWGIVIWGSGASEESLNVLFEMRAKVSLTCTWLFQGTKAILFFFIVYICLRYGHIRLGRREDKPEFSNLSYFAMIFAASTGPSLLVNSVVEPLFHRMGNFYAQAGYHSQDEIDMFAINMSVTNWGVTSFIHFTVVGICLALAGHRFRLPMIIRSCFYPMLGPYTWGWMGDIIDGVAIVVMNSGVCVSLAMTAMQIVDGFVALGWMSDKYTLKEIASLRNSSIWIITAVSTASIISGLKGGIQFMSRWALFMCTLLVLLVFFMDDTKFLMNLVVQEVGYYLQYSIFQLNFWTDAFGQLSEGSGRAIDGRAAAQNWMDEWIVFYQAWVVAMSAVVGGFIAFISRGRTIREVVMYGFVAPLVYCMVWFCVWGGVAQRQSRQGLELAALGEKYYGNAGHFLVDGSEFCYHVPQNDILVGKDVVFTNRLPGVSPVCEFDEDYHYMEIYNVLSSFSFPESFKGGGLGRFLTAMYTISCAVFFVANADPATFIIDTLSSNGRKNQHWLRRMFWSITAGAMATALSSSGAENASNALKAATVLCGLPVAIVLCYLMQSITLLCAAAERLDEDDEYEITSQPEFVMPVYGGIFNTMEYVFSLGKVNPARVELGMHQATGFQVVEFVKGLFIPFVSLSQVLAATYPKNQRSNCIVVVCYSICYIGWVVLSCMIHRFPGLYGLACACFVATGCILTLIRSGFRARYNLRSNGLADLTSSLFLWPQVFTQLRLQCQIASMKVVIEEYTKASD